MDRDDMMEQMHRTKAYYTRVLLYYDADTYIHPDDPIVRGAASEALLCRVVANQYRRYAKEALGHPGVRHDLDAHEEYQAISDEAGRASAAALAYVRALT